MGELRKLAGLLVSLAAAITWAVLAARTPTDTFHFAPMVVGAGWVVVDGSAGAGLTQRRMVNAAVGGVLIAVATAAILAVKGDLEGPTLWSTTGAGAVLGEHAVFAILGAAGGFLSALRTASSEPRRL